MKVRFFSIWTAMLLLFVTTGTFLNEAHASKKLMPVNVSVNGDNLDAVSSGGSGTIRKLQVWQSGNLILSQNCPNTYSCTMNISSLSPGNYVARVICTNETYEQAFTK